MARSSKQQGGKKTRKAPKAIGQWVSFVKKVAAEEGIKYNKAMKRASERSAAGEKWQTGGNVAPEAAAAAPSVQQTESSIVHSAAPVSGGDPKPNEQVPVPPQAPVSTSNGGGRRKTAKKNKKRSK